MKNTISFFFVAFLLTLNVNLFGQQQNFVQTDLHHNQAELFSAEIMNMVRMILEEPSLFFDEHGLPKGMEQLVDGAGLYSVEIVIELEFTDNVNPYMNPEPSIMHLPNTTGWISLDDSEWHSDLPIQYQPQTTSLGEWEFKVGAGEDGYY